MAKPESAWKQLGDWEATPKDYDPEAILAQNDSDNESRKPGVLDGTEHYLPVESGNIRTKSSFALGPAYQGSRVSRVTLEDESDSGQHWKVSDDEYEVETRKANNGLHARNPEGGGTNSTTGLRLQNGTLNRELAPVDFLSSKEGDVKIWKGPPSVSNGDTKSLENDGADSATSDSLGETGDEEASFNDESNGEGKRQTKSRKGATVLKPKRTNTAANSRSLRPGDGEKASGTLIPAVVTDAARGASVRQQRIMFDGLLNIRIRLQKGLIAANSAHVMDGQWDTIEQHEHQAADDALLKLWHTIASLRENMSTKKSGWKRKRPLDDSADDPADIRKLWDEMRGYDETIIPHRNNIMDKWSTKLRRTEVAAGDRRNNDRSGEMRQSLSETLRDRLSEPTQRLVNRSRVPRSCAPIQHSRKMFTDPQIYDDADFYQLLLKELVDQHAVEATSARANLVGIQQTGDATQRLAMREAKSHKPVDRKASRGRKMRFTVHEKLQNFMAREDRRAWEEGATDRFFGTLLGSRLDFEDEEPSDNGDDDHLPHIDDGIRLFRD